MPKLPDRDRSLAALPEDGTFITNREVRENIGLTDDRYWKVRRELLDDGLIVIGRGYGGRVALKQPANKHTAARKPPTPNDTREEIAEIEKEFKAETSLYQPFAEAIRKLSEDEGLDQAIVQVTAWATKKKISARGHSRTYVG
jgi:hypothetical protein